MNNRCGIDQIMLSFITSISDYTLPSMLTMADEVAIPAMFRAQHEYKPASLPIESDIVKVHKSGSFHSI